MAPLTVPENLVKQGIRLEVFKKLLAWGWVDLAGNSLSFEYYKTKEKE